LITWEGDDGEQINLYKAHGYSLDDKFFFDKQKEAGDACLKATSDCANTFITKHLQPNIF
jgi:hypothetical protein